ncbi:MAG TPA: RND transporter [Desulfoprunum sp.]|nr:RND transporter [Desulfoprunum sp.]
MNWLHRIPCSLLVILSLTLGLAPFTPLPHLIEKMQILAAGELVRPVDVFDLVMHSAPIVLLFMKITLNLSSKVKQ